MSPNNPGDNDKGTIHIDTKQISVMGSEYAKWNRGQSKGSVINALGAAVLGHEGQHGVYANQHANQSGHGWPINATQYRASEKSAVIMESYISQGLGSYTGTWAPGITASQLSNAINSAVDASVSSYCSNGGACP